MDSDKYSYVEFGFDCLWEYYEAAVNMGIKKGLEEEEVPRELYDPFFKLTTFWLNSLKLKQKCENYVQWNNAVTWHCFYTGIYMEMIRQKDESKIQEAYLKIVNDEINPLKEIPYYPNKEGQKTISSLCLQINEIGMKMREPYFGKQETSSYVLWSFYAVMHLGFAIQNEKKIQLSKKSERTID